MIPLAFALLPPVALAVATPNEWNEFANNFATDLAPIIALFGEQVTKQFLSESTSFLDNIIFGVAPLGILTAVVSVIRVYGNASLKSFIGRAQEAHGVAEAELCSSTSHDVCELWSNGGICRVFGRPRILEFLYTGKGEFYPKFSWRASGVEASLPPCGLYLPKTLMLSKTSTPGDDRVEGGDNASCWTEIDATDSEDDRDPEKQPERFAPHPNLSLNIGIQEVRAEILLVAAVFGVLLQLSFFVYATWATFYTHALYDNGDSPQLWSFYLAMSGTALLVVGMILCAMLIERKTCERRFTKKGPGNSPAIMFWLQPGDQRVGDQLFNAFAHSEEKQKYVTSWRVDPEPSKEDPDAVNRPLIVLWIAIAFSLLGFICQFVGLHGLHGSITLYQLASTLCMAAIRALLRSRRLRWEVNRLKGLHTAVEGHELDWQALNIEPAHQKHPPSWYIDDYPSPLKPPDQQNENENEVEVLESKLPGQRIVGFRPRVPGQVNAQVRCTDSAMNWIRFNELDNDQPNEAARILHFRSRLAYLTGDGVTPPRQEWNSDVRKMAAQLQEALQESADYIFTSDMKFSEGWKDAKAFAWSTTCQLSKPSMQSRGLPIHFFMHRNNGRWEISKYQLEAALGLWGWSVEQTRDQTNPFTKKVIVVEDSRKLDFTSAIYLWVSQTDGIDESKVQLPSEVGPISTPLSVSTTMLLGSQNSRVDELGTGSGNQVLLAIKTRSSPLQMIAQDIFTIFISRIADILEPLEPTLSQDQIANVLRNSLNQRCLGRVDAHVQSIADKLSKAGIGSREDALMSIFPPLLQRSKVPHLGNRMNQVLLRAVSEGRTEIAKFLVQKVKTDVNQDLQYREYEEYGSTLAVAAVRGRMEIVQFLVQEGKADVNQVLQYGEYGSALAAAAVWGWTEIVQFLVREAKADVNQVLQCGEYGSALAAAAYWGRVETVQFLVQEGKADVNQALQCGRYGSALATAAYMEETEIVQFLVQEGKADVNQVLQCGECGSALAAAAQGRKEIVQFLVQEGKADVNQALQCGKYGSALAAAADWGWTEIVQFLVREAKADVNQVLQCGEYGSALAAGVAATWKRMEIVQFLVREAKADVNQVLQRGEYGSALAAAAYLGIQECVEILIMAGAEVGLKLENGSFSTALQAARTVVTKEDLYLYGLKDEEVTKRKNEVADLLERYGATS
ncbi:hypothetical protein DL767_001460 [Monosporascus sp. MG133]|nr:hypothetical protein DL767_001460 [Monosporascus sp. MG133]